jgi:hypothetical protein
MKYITTLLLSLLSLSSFSQNSWVKVQFQPDQYPGETSWEIYNSEGEIVASSPQYTNTNFHETIVLLDEGGYNFVIYDVFGDGICCDFGEGYFGLTNGYCELNTFVYDFNSPQMTVYFNLLPCPPPVFGCMETAAINYNPWANNPGLCVFPPMPCADLETNIIILATPDSYPGETSWDLTVNNEVVLVGGGYSTTGITSPSYICVNEGDTLVANIYDSYGDGLCGSCWGGIDGYFDVTTLCGDSILFVGGSEPFDTVSSGPYIVPPCNPLIPQGCTNSDYVEYNPNAVIDDESCETLIQLGCVDSDMFNYDPLANTMDIHPSCDYTLTITDGGADGWFGSWLGVTQGDSIYGPYQMGPNDGYEAYFGLNLDSNEEVEVYFFTSGNAETTAAQCGFRLEGPNGIILQSGTNPWTDPLKKFPHTYSGVPTCLSYCVEFIYGCTDPEAQNYNMDANAEDDTCYYAAGCTQPGYLEYYAQGYEADYDDDSCNELAIFGCTDELALNYDPEANVDINTCIEVITDCMDPTAVNYNELANTPNNESCLYDAGCVGEPGDPYWLNDGCYAWVIDVSPNCCNTTWNGGCQDLYNYCEVNDETVGIIEYGSTHITVFPNPTTGFINIATSLQVDLSIYNSMGKLALQKNNAKQIDISNLSRGLYQMVLTYDGNKFTKKRIKQ